MSIFLIIALCFITTALFATLVLARTRFINKARQLSEKILNISPYSAYIKSNLYNCNNHFSSIATDFDSCFANSIITLSQKINFVNHYTDIYNEAKILVSKLKIFKINPSENILNLLHNYENIDDWVNRHNHYLTHELLTIHKKFFDNCLSYPLDEQQQRAILSEEDNCLIVSSAGSGKTSTIVGKVKYLIEKQKIDPSRILLISYTNKAASELTERIGIDGINGYTFHKLAIDIIGQQTEEKPLICDNSDDLIIKSYRELLANSQFPKHVLKYFSEHRINDSDIESPSKKIQRQLSEQKKVRLKALIPDMDNNNLYVRSEQEKKICFILSSLGVNFRYEESYEYPVADATHSQYKPDFSIYFKQEGIQRRIYLEHFGIDEHGNISTTLINDRNIPYEKANKLYNEGIKWKKATHKKFGTKLIVTTSADFYHSDIKETIKQQLLNAGVPLNERSDSEMYDMILKRGSKKEKAFIRLIATFITLLKSSCRSLNDVLQKAKENNDERSEYIIKYIFQPVYEHYTASLFKMGKIDFTDLILLATELCQESNLISYDYIIVDEFQDISVDRYYFLKALRNSNPPAKLFCVGDDWQSIYRFSGSDMALFNNFPKFFGPTEIKKIETTYRFGEPLISLSTQFIQRNKTQINKFIRPYDEHTKTEISFNEYNPNNYCDIINKLIDSIPSNKSILLLGRYSFDDYYLTKNFVSRKEKTSFII